MFICFFWKDFFADPEFSFYLPKEFVDDKNQTVSPLTNENLVHLSSRQALADLAHFVESMIATPALVDNNHLRGNGVKKNSFTATQGNKVTASCQWVTFGGSYPGMLAAWARLKYPHLIYAAVSNSAPIQAQVEMAEYKDRVAFDLQYEPIGGSVECLETFQQGHAQLIDALKQQQQDIDDAAGAGGEDDDDDDDEVRQRIADQFLLCNASSLLDPKNVDLFIGDGAVSVPAQSNDPACSGILCNTERVECCLPDCLNVLHHYTYDTDNADFSFVDVFFYSRTKKK
jgi:hypothetical protein